MIKKVLISAALAFALASGALAGDTVTIATPGGGTQIISSSVVAGAITASGAAGGATVGSVTQVTPGGNITVVVGGTTYVVSSVFIAIVLAYYS
ncbi:MAG: hypothetical protein ABI459_05920 [Deltaproteobacteria bacterium]